MYRFLIGGGLGVYLLSASLFIVSAQSETAGVGSGMIPVTGSALAGVQSNSGMQTETGLSTVLNIDPTNPVLYDPEYTETIAWLRDYEIISTSLTNFRPGDYITRQESAKIFSQFYRKILGGTGISGVTNDCRFADLAQTDYSLTDHVKTSCKLGIFRGSQGKFLPNDQVTRLQMIVILTRMFENKILSEDGDPRYLDYLLQAKAYNIISDTSQSSLDQMITRQELALTLYKYYIKHRLIANLNKPHSRIKMMTMLPNTIMTDSAGHKTVKAMINISQIEGAVGYQPAIDIFDDTYLLRQTKKVSYPELRDSYARYANLIDIGSDQVAGTVAFIVFNNMIEFATIRPRDFVGYYTITPYQAGYYVLTQIKD